MSNTCSGYNTEATSFLPVTICCRNKNIVTTDMYFTDNYLFLMADTDKIPDNLTF